MTWIEECVEITDEYYGRLLMIEDKRCPLCNEPLHKKYQEMLYYCQKCNEEFGPYFQVMPRPLPEEELSNGQKSEITHTAER